MVSNAADRSRDVRRVTFLESQLWKTLSRTWSSAVSVE